MRALSSRNAWIVVLALLGAGVASITFFTLLGDDAYIHARIARNLIEGNGAVFNIGDHFKADSSTGYVLLLAAVASFVPMETAIRVIEWVSVAAAIGGLGWLASLTPASFLRKLVATLAPIPYIAVAAYEGMETPLACAFMILGAVAWRRGRTAAYILLVALAACIRFEAIALLGLCLVERLATPPRNWRLLHAATPLVALFAFELWQFGSIVPHAAAAKSNGYHLPLWISAMFGMWVSEGPRGLWVGIALVLAFGAGAARIAAAKRLSVADAFLVFAAAVFTAWMLGRSLIFVWYFCMVAVPLAIWMLLDEPRSSKPSGLERMAAPAAMVALAGFCWFGMLRTIDSVTGHSATLRVPRYAQIGAALYAHCPSCTLVTSEIGGVGYTFRGPVWDAFGVADPLATPFHPMRVPEERIRYEFGGIPPGYVELRKPDFIVTMPVFALALRWAPIASRYYGYVCPVGDKDHVIAIFGGDDSVWVLSLTALPPSTLAAMRCTSMRDS